MKTPIVDFVRRYMDSGVSRFHMPGHKGKIFLGPEPYDITEIAGADVLYSAEGIIAQSEDNASALFGTAHTFYSTEGSTLAIKAMLMLASALAPVGERPLILAGRNAHKAFIYGAALLDIDVEWLYPENAEHICACNISAQSLESHLASAGRKPCAVYITSPDYLGRIADVRALADICEKYGVPLLVDNAHGAYLGFLEQSLHPMALGACMCADSAHKTLPVLTGGAYLHISKNAPREFLENARHALSVFASTSPSYVILQSLDMCNCYIADGYRERLASFIELVNTVKEKLSTFGFVLEKSEPLKIVINTAKCGYTGEEVCAYLRTKGMEAEFCDDEYLVLMLTPENGEDELLRLVRAFKDLPLRSPLKTEQLVLEKRAAVMPLRTAMLSRQEIIPVKEAEGRICASPTVSCPPAIPIVVSGEVIKTRDVKLFKRYGVEKIAVVKQNKAF
ncbi:MAG: hypothetical protein J6D11_01840 [Clostridia bacterium]|nr:hypothetical protein [Clostridia bacterium]